MQLWSYAGQQLDSWNIDFAFDPLESASVYQNSITAMISGKCQRDECFFLLTVADNNGNPLNTNILLTPFRVIVSPNFFFLDFTR